MPIAVAAAVFIVSYGLWYPMPVGVAQDDGIYVILAKALASGDGYTYINFPDAPRAVHFPPGYPALLAVLWSAWPSFPANTALFTLANIAFLSAAAAATYFLALRLDLDARIAAACTLAGFLMLPMLALSTALMSEPMWLALGIPWLLWAEHSTRHGDSATREHWKAAAMLGASAGALMLVRTQSAALLAGLLVVMVFRKRWRAAAIVFLSAAIVLLPWQIWVARYAHAIPDAFSGKYGAYGSWLADGVRAEGLHLFIGSLRKNSQAALHLIGGMLSVPGVPSLIAALTLVAPAIAGARRLARRTPVFFAAFCVYAGLVLVFPYEPQRYVWGSWPFVVLWITAGVVELWEWASAERQMHATRLVALRRASAALALASVVLVVAGAVVRSSIGLLTTSYRNIALGGARRLLPTVEWVRRNAPEKALIASDDETAVFLYTGRRAVPASVPSAASYVRPLRADSLSFELESVVRRYNPDLVIVNWRPAVVAAIRLSTGSTPLLRPIANLKSGAVFARVSR